MFTRNVLGFVAIILASSSPVMANDRAMLISIRAEPLSTALQDLARQTGEDLLFDRGATAGYQTPAIKGRYKSEIALQMLLRNTDLVARRGATGAWIIGARTASSIPAADVLPVPEILVIGRRTQNVDIRRRENDIQPYQVATGERLSQAHRDTIDQYFASRVTSNTQAVLPSMETEGNTNSEIDIRGFGPASTLVLIDGRRMPGIPAGAYGFHQPDLNGIPVHAIDRIETLTGTASGIYGFGALGGVVNVVLKRDYRGFDVHATGGITSRGDAGKMSLEGRVGFTPDGGQTDVMLYASHTAAQALKAGQRDYLQRYANASLRLTPDRFRDNNPSTNAVNVYTVFDDELTLKPSYGGATLGADHTFIPLGFTGSNASLVGTLLQNAGKYDLTPNGGAEADILGSDPTVTSFIANVRRSIGSHVEAYFDAVILRNRGWSNFHSWSDLFYLEPDAATNPFEQGVFVTFPVAAQNSRYQRRFNTSRYTGGLIVDLPHSWKATAETTFGRVYYREKLVATQQFLGPFSSDDDPGFNPLGNWDQFQAATLAYRYNVSSDSVAINRYSEQSLRLAGPLFRLPAGPATLTLLAEHRREEVQESTQFAHYDLGGIPTEADTMTPGRSSTSTSFYGELRGRVFDNEAPLPFLRDLEFQLAARHDYQRLTFSFSASAPGSPTKKDFAGTDLTVGAKVTPLSWLMLRGSYAIGQDPPTVDRLRSLDEIVDIDFVTDPKRNDTYLVFVDEGAPYRKLSLGSINLKTLRAKTLSLGFVLNPANDKGPRISLDYSRIRESGDVFYPTEDYILAHESDYPDRVVRAPLTAADRALGYTGGQITLLDVRAMNAGGFEVETLDGRIDWNTRLLNGILHSYAAATLQMRQKYRSPEGPPENQVGYLGGPLRWRANAGIDWVRGPIQRIVRARISTCPGVWT